MKKLLLILSLIVLPVTGAISWDRERKTYYSTNDLWLDSFDGYKYHILASVANGCISAAVLMDSEERYTAVRDFVQFLKMEGSYEAFVLLLDLNEVFAVYNDPV